MKEQNPRMVVVLVSDFVSYVTERTVIVDGGDDGLSRLRAGRLIIERTKEIFC